MSQPLGRGSSMSRTLFVAIAISTMLNLVQGFVAPTTTSLASPMLQTLPTDQTLSHGRLHPSRSMMMDPSSWMDDSTISAVTSASSSSMWMAFTDQGQNLAGSFFQASLLPYLLFLYFLAFRGNQIPTLSNFGFQFILLFVISTIPAGIISKSVYGMSLANVDYLHGGAELLLTVANILIVLGLKETMTKGESSSDIGQPRKIALAMAASFAALCAIGPMVLVGDAGAHSPFLFGWGDIPHNQVLQFPWVTHSEPDNALSIPTWLIHFSSVLEYWIGMGLVWQYASTTGNERWKGLTWGMLPLHASGICACTYHFFYNPSSLQFLVTAQAGLTLLGNITLMLAAYRIAASNGWSPQELLPSPNQSTNPQGLVADGLAMKPLTSNENNLVPLPGVVGWVVGPSTSNVDLALNLGAATVFLSYLVKYGSLGLDAPFMASPYLATAMIVGIPGLTAYSYYAQSKSERGGDWNPLADLPSTSSVQTPAFLSGMFGNNNATDGGGETGSAGKMPSLSMADIKKYGAAGTVAYVLTELAFWAVAFPVASFALYQSSGHWPDVVHDTTDRAAVLAFVFAGANIARLLVPLRLGAALALAPWVDDNILKPIQEQRQQQESSSAAAVKESTTVEEPITTTPTPPKPPPAAPQPMSSSSAAVSTQEEEEDDEVSLEPKVTTDKGTTKASMTNSMESQLESAKGWFSSLGSSFSSSFSNAKPPSTSSSSSTVDAPTVVEPETSTPPVPLAVEKEPTAVKDEPMVIEQEEENETGTGDAIVVQENEEPDATMDDSTTTSESTAPTPFFMTEATPKK